MLSTRRSVRLTACRIRRDVLVLLAPLQNASGAKRPFGTYLLSSKKEKKKENENEGEKVRLLE